MRKHGLAFGIIGLIILVATISIGAILQNGTPTVHDWVGFSFLLFSEIAFFGGFVGINVAARYTSKIITFSGCGIVVGCYSLATFIISLIYLNIPSDDIKVFLVIQILLFSVAAIFFIITLVLSKTAHVSEISQNNKKSKLMYTADQLRSLTSNVKYGPQIEELSIKLGATDLNNIVSVDPKIEESVSHLYMSLSMNPQDDNEITNLLKALASLIDSRKELDRPLRKNIQ